MSSLKVMSILAVVLLWASPGAAAKRVALVIGNGAYARISALGSPVNDAKLMATALRKVGFHVINGVDMTKEDMESAIIDFGQRLRAAGQNAEGLFYYSGHGVQSRGVNYLIPLNAPITEESSLNIKAVPAWWVLDQMDGAKNRLNLVVLDACRNNPFKVGTAKSSIGTGGLQAVNAPTGTLIAYAAAPGKVAYDGRGVDSPYSPFTEALVEAMDQPGLPVEDVLKRVRRAVRKRTNNRQQPWWASSLEGSFAFRSRPSDGPPTAPAPTVVGVDRAAYEAAKPIDTIAAYLAVKNKFPNSFYADLALDRVRILRAQREKALGLTREERQRIQKGLAKAGLDPGGAGGEFDRLTRAAIRRWQKSRGKEGTGYLLDEASAEALLALSPPESPRAVAATPPVAHPPGQDRSTTLVIDDADSRFWLEIKGKCAHLEEYYTRYPNGRHISEYWQRRRECAAAR